MTALEALLLALVLAVAAASAAAAVVRRRLESEHGTALARAARAASLDRAAVEAERDRLATLLRELNDAVVIVGEDDRIRTANPAAERLFASGDLAGRRVIDVIRDHETLDALERARAGEEVLSDVERHDPPRTLRVAARALPGRDRLLAVQDLTRMRRLETVRRDFVANVSHELRTPITSLKAMAEILEQGALNDPAAASDFVARMHREIDEMAQLVSELLALARTESGTDQLALRRVAPADLLADAVRRARPLADRARVRLVLEETPGLPPVRADADRIGQVLANLLHNAVKFTPPEGSVIARADALGDAVRFSVRDTGAGIPAQDLERIFERFYKADRARAGGGTGLGLAIAKHIVQAHGGEISAASDGQGTGATIGFTLPLA